jgi:hypothetical protein
VLITRLLTQRLSPMFRCSTGISGLNRVYTCQGGSYVFRTCRTNSTTKLYEKDCQFFPDEVQTEKASIMFMQSIDSVSMPTIANRIYDQGYSWFYSLFNFIISYYYYYYYYCARDWSKVFSYGRQRIHPLDYIPTPDISDLKIAV